MTEGTEGLLSNTRVLWDVCGSGMDNINIMKLLMSKVEKCSGKIIIQHQLSLDIITIITVCLTGLRYLTYFPVFFRS